MIDHCDLLCRDYGHIAGTVLTVHCDQKSVHRLLSGMRQIFQRNSKLFHHQRQVCLSHFVFPGIQQSHIFSLITEKTIQSKPGRYRIRIRIVMALDRDPVISQQFLQHHFSAFLCPSSVHNYAFLIFLIKTIQNPIRKIAFSRLTFCSCGYLAI